MLIQELADGITHCLTQQPGSAGLRQACEWVAKAVNDEEFTLRYLADRAKGEPIREILYHHPQLDYCICGQVYGVPNKAGPHDHGHTWAIYGQVTGDTVMTDWTRVDPDSQTVPIPVVPVSTYTLKPGDAHLYDVGDIHSPLCDTPVKLIRIEGSNLEHVTRQPYIAQQ